MIVLLESTFIGIRSSSLCRRPSRWLSSKQYACKAGAEGDGGSIPGSRRSPGGGRGNPLQYSCLENTMDRGAWWATVQRVAKTQTQLTQLSTEELAEGKRK